MIKCTVGARFAVAAALVFLVAPAFSVSAAGVKSDNGGRLVPAGYLSTRGNQIVDSHGNPVRIDSIGWGGSNHLDEAVDDLDRASYQSIMNGMELDGFNCARISWTDAGLRSTNTVLNYIDYGMNPDLKGLTQMQMLDKIVAYAGRIGFKIILDHHVDEGLHPADQQRNGLWFDSGPGTDGTDGAGHTGTVTAQVFQDDWVAVAKRYAGNSTVIGFDLDNEPVLSAKNQGNWGGGGPTDIWAAYTSVGDAIQKVDPDALIICEGPQDDFVRGTLLYGRYDLSHVADKPIVLDIPNKVLYSVHEYPNEVADRLPDTGPDYVAVMNPQWGYLEAQNIAPVWIGEMGAGLAADDTDGKAWIGTLLPYVDGLYGYLGGPVFHGDQQPISTDWWSWVEQTSGSHWGTVLNYNPLTFDPAEKAVTDDLTFVVPQQRY